MSHKEKLHTIKHSARHGNLKKICYTVAKRNQHAFCYYLHCGKSFLERPKEISNTLKETLTENVSQNIKSFIEESHLNITLVGMCLGSNTVASI